MIHPDITQLIAFMITLIQGGFSFALECA